MSADLLFIVGERPRAPEARERVDQVLTALAFDATVRVLFRDDGVWQLVGNIARSYRSLALYGVAGVLAEAESLAERGLVPQDLEVDVALIPRSELATLIAAHDHLP